MTPKHVAHAAQSTPGVQVASLTVGHHNAQCVRAVEERLFVRNNVGMPETGQHGCLWPVVQTALDKRPSVSQPKHTSCCALSTALADALVRSSSFNTYCSASNGSVPRTKARKVGLVQSCVMSCVWRGARSHKHPCQWRARCCRRPSTTHKD
jgi:hypothetical protein